MYTLPTYIYIVCIWYVCMYEYAIVARSAPTPLLPPSPSSTSTYTLLYIIWRRYGRASTVHDVCGGSFPFGPHGLSVSFPCLSTIPPASSGSRFTSRSAAPCYMEIILCLFEGVHVESLVETVWPTYTQGLREHFLPNERWDSGGWWTDTRVTRVTRVYEWRRVDLPFCAPNVHCLVFADAIVCLLLSHAMCSANAGLVYHQAISHHYYDTVDELFPHSARKSESFFRYQCVCVLVGIVHCISVYILRICW